MSRIARRIQQAGVYFVTTHTWQRRALFQKEQPAQILLAQNLDCRGRGFYSLHAFVIMPDHLHLLITPAEAVSLEKTMQMIKGGSAHRIRKELLFSFPVWQSGFHDRWIRTGEEFRARLDYIAKNPLLAHLAESVREYRYSSSIGKFRMDPSQFDARTSGAKALVAVAGDVAAKACLRRQAATHKAETVARASLSKQAAKHKAQAAAAK